jgi:hypothetical protein
MHALQADPAPVKVVGVSDLLNAAVVCTLPVPSSARAQMDVISGTRLNTIHTGDQRRVGARTVATEQGASD